MLAIFKRSYGGIKRSIYTYNKHCFIIISLLFAFYSCYLQTLHEELIECSFPNPLHTDDSVGAITYVKEVEKDVSEEIEAIIVRTVGIKNYNVHPSLIGKELPLEVH